MLIRLQRIYNFFISPCYYIICFGCLMGFNINFYIIFGTNLLTESPVQIAIFCLFQCFTEKEYQMEWNLRESYFWNKRDPGDLEWTKETRRPWGREARPHPRGPLQLHRATSSSYIYPYTPKTSRSTMKPYFHRRNLLYPWDPILGPFPALRRRGNRSRKASTSTP